MTDDLANQSGFLRRGRSMKTRIFNTLVNFGAAILIMEAVKYVNNATPADNVVISMGGIIIFGLLDLGDKIKGDGL